VFYDSDLFGILPIEVLSLFVHQPFVGSVHIFRTHSFTEPAIEQLIGWIARQRVVELVDRNPPALHHPFVHRTRIDVIVDRSGRRGAAFIRDAQQPERIANRLTTTPRKGFSIAKIGRHAPHNAPQPQRVAPASQRTVFRMQVAAAAPPRHEPRWHASVAVLGAVLLYITLPPRLTIGPVWIAPALVLVVLIPLSIFAPHRHIETRRTRFASIILIAIVNFFNLVSVLLLVAAFFRPETAALHQPGYLLRTGAQIWFTNILVFALWFWELDGDGPDARAHAAAATEFENADFLYPQMQMTMMSGGAESKCVDPRWKPQFFDYFYLAFTTATAFSPCDVLPLSRWAKALMTAEALVSLITVAIVLARAISLIS
jgi:hypothetical protein